jgi:hypothetical protein
VIVPGTRSPRSCSTLWNSNISEDVRILSSLAFDAGSRLQTPQVAASARHGSDVLFAKPAPTGPLQSETTLGPATSAPPTILRSDCHDVAFRMSLDCNAWSTNAPIHHMLVSECRCSPTNQGVIRTHTA